MGLNNADLAEKWKDEPESYMSVAAPDMPNYFLMMGPNAVVGHGVSSRGISQVCSAVADDS